MQAPSVPPSTMKRAGMLMTAMTLEPSSVAPSAIERPPTTTPMRPDIFMSAALPGGLGTGGGTGGAAHDRQAVDASGGAAPRQCGLEHARAPLGDRGDDLLRTLGHEQLGAGREGHDGVRRRLDRDEEVRVEVVVLVGMSEAVKSNHGSVWSRQGPLPSRHRTRAADLNTGSSDRAGPARRHPDR